MGDAGCAHHTSDEIHGAVEAHFALDRRLVRVEHRQLLEPVGDGEQALADGRIRAVQLARPCMHGVIVLDAVYCPTHPRRPLRGPTPCY